MDDKPTLPKSQFKVGGKRLDEMGHLELLEAVDTIWSSKNEEIDRLKAERDGLRDLLASSLPVHSLWRGFAENAMLIVAIAVLAYLAGVRGGV